MDQTRAITIGLAALYCMSSRAKREPFMPSAELRALLALLHLHSDGDRRPFDAYWRSATQTDIDYPSELIASVCRRNGMLAAWHDIARSLGTEATIDFMASMARVPTGEPPRTGGL
ncbi:hypothetical protein [Sphingomonas sp. Leaf62]|uniref:hypothetical protein n=1 Tax=Sphingomonas sp. Leaf62 TaxID=1736228 RepID=UPI000AB7421E|nr:hypothetical protein [Sphingomonas sp. Leaf62]